MFVKRVLGSLLLACCMALGATHSAYSEPTGASTSRLFTLLGTSLDMPDSDIVDHLTSELGLTPDQYSFPRHRVSHFGDSDCGWKRIDNPPPCFGFSVLSVNFDGEHKTFELVLTERFRTPLDLDGLRAKMIESFGEPDYASDPKPFGSSFRGWFGGQYLWSEEFPYLSEMELKELLGAVYLRDAKAGSDVWLRMQLNLNDAAQVVGMKVELADQELNTQRAEHSAALRREEYEQQAKKALEDVRLR